MTVSTTRIRLAEAQLRAALAAYRRSLPVGVQDQEDAWDRLAEAVATAARTVALEHGRWSWLKAASDYGVPDVQAMTDWQLEGERAGAPR